MVLSIFRLQDEHNFEIVGGSQFWVSRTAFKEGGSEYRLNGQRTTFKDVGILLREQGIDLDHNRFLILQVIPLVTVYVQL